MNRFRCLVFSAFCAVSVASTVHAQKNPYARIAAPDGKPRTTLKTAANKAIRSKPMTTADRKAVRDYVLRCGIAPIATPSAFAADGMKLGEFRKVVVDMLKLSGAQQPVAHTDIVRLCEQHLIGDKKKIRGIINSSNLPPASRLNAMLLLADLNTTEDKRAPKPSSTAGAFMTAVVGSKKHPQYLRIAALNGLRRHAACGAIRSKNTLNAVVAILKEEPASDMQPEALIWQRRLAIETLGLMKTPAVAKYIAPHLMDKNSPLELRCAAAEALGRLKFKSGSKTVAAAIAPVGAVAVAACSEEVERINAELIHREQDGGPTVARGFGADPTEIPVDPIVQTTRRVLLDRLDCVSTGMKGLSTAAAGQQLNLASAVANHISTLQDLLTSDAKTMTPDELRGRIASTASQLQRIVVTK